MALVGVGAAAGGREAEGVDCETVVRVAQRRRQRDGLHGEPHTLLVCRFSRPRSSGAKPPSQTWCCTSTSLFSPMYAVESVRGLPPLHSWCAGTTAPRAAGSRHATAKKTVEVRMVREMRDTRSRAENAAAALAQSVERYIASCAGAGTAWTCAPGLDAPPRLAPQAALDAAAAVLAIAFGESVPSDPGPTCFSCSSNVMCMDSDGSNDECTSSNVPLTSGNGLRRPDHLLALACDGRSEGDAYLLGRLGAPWVRSARPL